jgi:hypothetical protein
MLRFRRTAPVACAVIAVALLGACGGNAPSTGPSSGGVAGPEAAAADPAEAAAAGAGGSVNVCDLVAPETAERLVGDSSGEIEDVDLDGNKDCNYDGEAGGTLLVALLPADSYDTWATLFDPTPVDGIGDKAGEADGKLVYQIAAVKGDHFVQFSVAPPVSDSGKIGTVDKPASREALTEALSSL